VDWVRDLSITSCKRITYYALFSLTHKAGNISMEGIKTQTCLEHCSALVIIENNSNNNLSWFTT